VARGERERREDVAAALRAAAARRVAEAPGDEPTGQLEPEYIRARIRELVPLIAECYELALADDPTLSGRLVVEFGITGEPGVGGIVDESRIDAEASDLSHPVLNECVRETLYTAELDAPEGGGRVTVRYPFVLNRAEPEDRGI
jgi:hypothetical protein